MNAAHRLPSSLRHHNEFQRQQQLKEKQQLQFQQESISGIFISDEKF
jgi:hypothetical protein